MVDIIGRKPRKVDPLETAVTINPQNYALIQEGNQAVCAISMTQGYNEDNQEDTITKVLRAGLGVPKALRFIRQLLNVNQAVQGHRFLYDASGDLIEGDRLEAYLYALKNTYGIWSPESFRKGEGYLDLDVITISKLDGKGNPVYKREPLKRCLKEDCYAELDSANSQGFLTRKAKIQKHNPGKTIHFCYPKKDKVVRFGANPYDDFFDCGADPQFVLEDVFGAFPCVEEAVAEK